MTSLTYLVVAVVGLALIGISLFRMIHVPRTDFAEADEREPMTPLQKRAWVGLAIGAAVSTALVVLFVVRGTPLISQDKTLRLTSWALMLAGGTLWGALLWFMRAREREAQLDERDRSILAGAPAVQSGAVLVVMALWTVTLTEIYWERGVVPLDYLSLIFFSCLITHLVALPAGILLGYRRERYHAQG